MAHDPAEFETVADITETEVKVLCLHKRRQAKALYFTIILQRMLHRCYSAVSSRIVPI